MTFLADNPLVVLIGACEVAFWVLVGAGLAARYLLRMPRLSTWLLVAVPVVDVVLVTASLVDVARGTPPGLTHGLAAVYLGCTVAFGHSMVRWADARFAHRFAGGPPPAPSGRGAAYEWREWGKAALAWTITVAVLAATALVAGAGLPSPAEWSGDPLWNWAWRLGIVVVIWFVGWPLWETLSPRQRREPSDA